ncbi:MAG: DUF2179 domain-containing protein [Thermoplasmatales archaeon]|nr:MAG: DUF2179 domain-containing protein [Thermoplasmatales archaeon]
MEFFGLTGVEVYGWIVLPLLIFFARVCDVSLGTIRIIFVSKGLRYLAPIIGFFEILVWLMAIGQIMQNLTNVYYYVFYAGGFAMGNLVGIIIEEKLSIGTVGIRIITRREAKELIIALRKADFGVTAVDADGAKGKLKIIFTVVNRQNIQEVIKIVKQHNPNAFYSIEDIRFVSETLSPHLGAWYKRGVFTLFKGWRKGK